MLVGLEGRGYSLLGGSLADRLVIPHAKGLADLESHRMGEGWIVPCGFSMVLSPPHVHWSIDLPLAVMGVQWSAEDTALIPRQFQWDSVLKQNVCSHHLYGWRPEITSHKKDIIFMRVIPGHKEWNKTQRKRLISFVNTPRIKQYEYLILVHLFSSPV